MRPACLQKSAIPFPQIFQDVLVDLYNLKADCTFVVGDGEVESIFLLETLWKLPIPSTR